ncbi:FecR family protein [Mucilaginibacter pineti]|uniref:FecR family protein n=1 Tax=Mucilaginibacter pineti TaxID=1391627 RepID=A0A1G7ISC0_9SPHI|nr:FecR family protein [Mucilaginibacter pineti]SDF15209.1 FecR family protein [Mucilaginibacter pineti]
MNDQEADDLLARYLNDDVSEDEKAVVNEWYHKLAAGEELPDPRQDFNQVKSVVWNKIQRKRIIPFYRYAAAAVLLIFFGIGGYNYYINKSANPVKTNIVQDILPGGNKAILTLANGKKIILNNRKNGLITHEKQTAINKTNDGHLVYTAPVKKDASVIFNTITTPRGGKYELTLSDGSEVTLDAASSIKYPVNFTGKERLVEITGQAYFEVAHDKTKPFKVKAGEQTVEVLGTHFNINSYGDEPAIITTLLQGSIKISIKKDDIVLTPGKQALVNYRDKIIRVQNADTEAAIAWKEGHFHFNKAGIPDVMRQLSRWYDVDIEYQGDIPKRSFSGNINRNTKASVALQILTASRVNFKISGRKIIVTP